MTRAPSFINTIGAPGVFPPRCSAEDRAGGSPSVRPVATFDSAGDCNPRAVTFSDCNLSHKAADNIANALNSSRPFVSVSHVHKHGEIECAKTRPGWTGK